MSGVSARLAVWDDVPELTKLLKELTGQPVDVARLLWVLGARGARTCAAMGVPLLALRRRQQPSQQACVPQSNLLPTHAAAHVPCRRDTSLLCLTAVDKDHGSFVGFLCL